MHTANKQKTKTTLRHRGHLLDRRADHPGGPPEPGAQPLPIHIYIYIYIYV